jgi:hypothetical protein
MVHRLNRFSVSSKRTCLRRLNAFDIPEHGLNRNCQINKTYAVFRLIMIETMKNELPGA